MYIYVFTQKKMINLKLIILIALMFEIITITFRFGLKISSKKIYVKLMNKYHIKKFIHIHHLFLGILIMSIFIIYPNNHLMNLGIGIALSDVIHHFLVLFIILRNPEFHIIYKNIKEYKKEEENEKKQIKKFYNHLIKEIKNI